MVLDIDSKGTNVMDDSINSQKLRLVIVFNKRTNELTIDVAGLVLQTGGEITIISSEENRGASSHVSISARDQALRCKGVLIEQSKKGHTCIYSDPFCTIPVYFEDRGEEIFIASSPNLIIDYSKSVIDPVGFWENVVFGTGIWTRTPFLGLFQLPSACCLELDRNANVSRYWNFTNEPSANDTDKDNHQWLTGLDSLLTEKFQCYHNRKLVMGLSGGMDSRLAALYLSVVEAAPENIHFFTYAATPVSYEFKYAKHVSSALDFYPPELFVLNDAQYEEALEFMPFWTAGQIGNNHSHIVQYLKHMTDKGGTHLSTYYSDALFGWECDGVPSEMNVKLSTIYQKAITHPWVPDVIREQMRCDIQESLKGATETSGLSNMDEFRYISERTPKFHMALAFVQSQFVQTVTPFADYDLLKYILTVPLALRKQKRVVDELIEYKNPRLSRVNNCSSREYFYGKNNLLVTRGLEGRVKYLHFRMLNALNAWSVFLANGKNLLQNPFQTEELGALYKRVFSNKMLEGLQVLGDSGVFGQCTDFEKFSGSKVRERYLSEKYQLLNFAHLVSAGSKRSHDFKGA
jgi:hypothetical protein